MPSLLPRKISAAASVLQAAGHWPSPCVHWVDIFKKTDQATSGFTRVTACCFVNWELTTPCLSGLRFLELPRHTDNSLGGILTRKMTRHAHGRTGRGRQSYATPFE